MAEIIDTRERIFPVNKIFATSIEAASDKDFVVQKDFTNPLVTTKPNCIEVKVIEKKAISQRSYILYSKFFPHGTLDITRIKVQSIDSVTCTKPLAYLNKPVVTIVFINNIQLNQLEFDNNPAQPQHIHYVISRALANSEGIVITFKFMVDEFNAGAIKDTPEEIDKMIELLNKYDDGGYKKMGMLTSYSRYDIDVAAQKHNMSKAISPRPADTSSRPADTSLPSKGGKNYTRRRTSIRRRTAIRRRTSIRRRRTSIRRRRTSIRRRTSTRRRKIKSKKV